MTQELTNAANAAIDERIGLPSASAFRRYELCAGSWQLEAEARRLGQEAHVGSAAAKRGALIHAWLAGEVDEDGTEIKLDDSEVATADFLQERATDQVKRIFGDEPTQQLSEKRLWFTLNGQLRASGQFDRCIYTPSVALVQDFKTGWSEPDPAEQNAQMKFLAVAVALHLPRSLRKVIVQVISGPHGVSEATYDYPALAKAYSDVLGTLRAIQDERASLVPSVEACRYCPAINVCPAVKKLVPTMSEAEALPDGTGAADLLGSVEILQKRIDAIREYYAGRLTDDPSYAIPGWAMVPGVVRREVADWEAARQRLGEWLEIEDIQGAANYRLGDLEKALGRKLQLRGKELKARMGEILQGLIEERPNAASLKRVKGAPKPVTAEP